MRSHKILHKPGHKGNALVRKVAIQNYTGHNPYVLRMAKYLTTYLREDLVGAYVHGSLGTYEEIAYSDFDALVILKNECFESPVRLARVARLLSLARKIMYRFDPLQHHGWFVLAEPDLDCYPDDYFPLALFDQAKSLFRGLGTELSIQGLSSEPKYTTAFENLSSSLLNCIERKKFPRNVYQLKSLLSQFMLLPAFYVQARDSKGVLKKNSFQMAKDDFDQESWSIMDEVSDLRGNWSYTISPFTKWLITRPTQLSRYLVKKIAPPIPCVIQSALNSDFYSRMRCLTTHMQKKLQPI